MKTPVPPPDTGELLSKLREQKDPDKLVRILTRQSAASEDYIPWDKLRYKTPPKEFTHEEWWLAVKFARHSMQRRLPLKDEEGVPFIYALPDEVLRAIEKINSDTSGSIGIAERVTNSATRDRYLVNSLIEEAITSSQLEGAPTTRNVAKEMIRSGRTPKDRHERMILNNYIAMRKIGELRDDILTPDLICEIHRIVTEDTLDNSQSSGRFQIPGEERIEVHGDGSQVLHRPLPLSCFPKESSNYVISQMV